MYFQEAIFLLLSLLIRATINRCLCHTPLWHHTISIHASYLNDKFSVFKTEFLLIYYNTQHKCKLYSLHWRELKLVNILICLYKLQIKECCCQMMLPLQWEIKTLSFVFYYFLEWHNCLYSGSIMRQWWNVAFSQSGLHGKTVPTRHFQLHLSAQMNHLYEYSNHASNHWSSFQVKLSLLTAWGTVKSLPLASPVEVNQVMQKASTTDYWTGEA